MHLTRRAVAFAATLTMTAGITAALAMPASASAPAAAPASAALPFPVYDNGSALVTAHPVFTKERLVIKGRPFTLGEVDRHGPAYIAHVLSLLPAAWKGKTLAAVPEG